MITSAQNDTEDLPEFVNFSERAFEEYYPSWVLWVATERKFLPQSGGLDDQSELQMQVLLELDAYYEKMKDQQKESP